MATMGIGGRVCGHCGREHDPYLGCQPVWSVSAAYPPLRASVTNPIRQARREMQRSETEASDKPVMKKKRSYRQRQKDAADKLKNRWS